MRMTDCSMTPSIGPIAISPPSASRFHLGDWHRTIDEKLKTLDDLYQILQSDRNNRWMLTLEVRVVLLFVIDLVLLFLGARR